MCRMPRIEKLAAELLRILPPDASKLQNSTARTLLGQAVEKQISKDVYFDVLKLLASREKIQRGRGPGGSVGLSESNHGRQEDAPQSRLTEAQLMPSVQRYLEYRFWKQIDIPPEGYWKVIDTSTGGEPNGTWRRADFTAIAVSPRDVLPGSNVELHTFELKPEYSGDIPGVLEAHAQTRGSHFGYLIWHLPDNSGKANRLQAVESECERVGIGLIIFKDPQDLDTWHLRIRATRKTTNTRDIDKFLAARLNSQQIDELKDRL